MTGHPPLSAAERRALGVAVAAWLAFGVWAIASHSSSTVGYLGSVVVIGFAIAYFRTSELPGRLPALLAVAVVVHLAGGFINVGSDVLYNASVGPYVHGLHTHPLQYDHFAHAYASFVGAVTLWALLRQGEGERERRDALFVVVVALAGAGIGALNELFEYLATLAHHGGHVGGYDNTGWDLAANCVGVIVAAWHITRSRPATSETPSLSSNSS
ncbi:MAG TPA: DUF2238 domain-containing protein [Acidimicrobiia bacterium]